MKISVFGGTGDVGKAIVDKLTAKNQIIKVLTRQAKASTEKVNYITGNVLDYHTVEGVIEKDDLVIISLGFNNSARDTMSKGTQNILNAIKVKNCKRLICLSAQGVGDSWEYMPIEFKEMVNKDPILKSSFEDHGIQELIIKSTEIDWTIVRPTEIVDTTEKRIFSINYPAKDCTFQISKYDVAQFIIDELFEKQYSGKTVMITS